MDFRTVLGVELTDSEAKRNFDALCLHLTVESLSADQFLSWVVRRESIESMDAGAQVLKLMDFYRN